MVTSSPSLRPSGGGGRVSPADPRGHVERSSSRKPPAPAAPAASPGGSCVTQERPGPWQPDGALRDCCAARQSSQPRFIFMDTDWIVGISPAERFDSDLKICCVKPSPLTDSASARLAVGSRYG